MNTLTPFYITFVLIEMLSGAARGAGDSLIPTIITCFGVCVLRVAWILIAVPLYPDVKTVIYSYPITWILTSVLFLIYYLQGGWLRRRIAKARPKNGSPVIKQPEKRCSEQLLRTPFLFISQGQGAV